MWASGAYGLVYDIILPVLIRRVDASQVGRLTSGNQEGQNSPRANELEHKAILGRLFARLTQVSNLLHRVTAQKYSAGGSRDDDYAGQNTRHGRGLAKLRLRKWKSELKLCATCVLAAHNRPFKRILTRIECRWNASACAATHWWNNALFTAWPCAISQSIIASDTGQLPEWTWRQMGPALWLSAWCRWTPACYRRMSCSTTAPWWRAAGLSACPWCARRRAAADPRWSPCGASLWRPASPAGILSTRTTWRGEAGPRRNSRATRPRSSGGHLASGSPREAGKRAYGSAPHQDVP